MNPSLPVVILKPTEVYTEVFQRAWKIGTLSDTRSQPPLPASNLNLMFFLFAARGFISISSQRLSMLEVGGVPPSVCGFGVVTSSGAAAASTHGGGLDVTSRAMPESRPPYKAAGERRASGKFAHPEPAAPESDPGEPRRAPRAACGAPSPAGPASTAAHSPFPPGLPPPPPPAAAPEPVAPETATPPRRGTNESPAAAAGARAAVAADPGLR